MALLPREADIQSGIFAVLQRMECQPRGKMNVTCMFLLKFIAIQYRFEDICYEFTQTKQAHVVIGDIFGSCDIVNGNNLFSSTYITHIKNR